MLPDELLLLLLLLLLLCTLALSRLCVLRLPMR
jgi:hypothetical protein